LFLGRGGGGDPDQPRTAESYAEEFGGDPARYEALLQWDDCDDLYRGFFDAEANYTNGLAPRSQWLGQMEVMGDRIDAIGCDERESEQ
jgi:hypothetical protein